MKIIPIIDITGIPEGSYCYSIIKWDGLKLYTKTCPYHDWVDFDAGYAKCTKFDIDDYRDGTLLWDKVKECGYNLGEYDD